MLLRLISGQLYQLMLQLVHYGYPQRLCSSCFDCHLHLRVPTRQPWQTCFFGSVPCSLHLTSPLSTAYQLQLSSQSQTASLSQWATWPTSSFKSNLGGTTWSICHTREWTMIYCCCFEIEGGSTSSIRCLRGVIAVREAVLPCFRLEMVDGYRRLRGWPGMLSFGRVIGDTIEQCAISASVISRSKEVALVARLAFRWQA